MLCLRLGWNWLKLGVVFRVEKVVCFLDSEYYSFVQGIDSRLPLDFISSSCWPVLSLARRLGGMLNAEDKRALPSLLKPRSDSQSNSSDFCDISRISSSSSTTEKSSFSLATACSGARLLSVSSCPCYSFSLRPGPRTFWISSSASNN